MSSRATLSQRFHSNPSINPRTESRIKVGGPTYQSLVAEFGAPTAVTSPSRARVSSPSRSSATSPARSSFYSPARAASSSQMGSPSRARSTMSPARVSGRSKSPRRSSSRSKSPRRSKSPARGTIINPMTKRPIQINGSIYDRLAQSGILDGTFVPRTSGRQRFPVNRLAAQPLPRKSPRKSPPKAHAKAHAKAHSKSPRKTHVKSPRKVHSKPGHIVNPESGRPIKINGPTYARLSQAGKI